MGLGFSMERVFGDKPRVLEALGSGFWGYSRSQKVGTSVASCP